MKRKTINISEDVYKLLIDVKNWMNKEWPALAPFSFNDTIKYLISYWKSHQERLEGGK